MDREKVKIVQELLGITADGVFGGQTRKGIRGYYDFPENWGDERLLIGCIQVICMKNDINTGEVDGYWGNKTAGAWSKLLAKCGMAEAKVEVDMNVSVKKGFNNWPRQNYSSMVNYYGPVGKNQTSLILPYPMVLAWDLDRKVTKMTCHSKVKDSLETILKNVLGHYGLEKIKQLRLDRFGGCLNVRKMRGGSSWSIHSWGAAIDLDPDRNRLRWGRDKAYFARSEYEPFWKIVEAEGWTSLGRKRNYDWMHFQAANL